MIIDTHSSILSHQSTSTISQNASKAINEKDRMITIHVITSARYSSPSALKLNQSSPSRKS